MNRDEIIKRTASGLRKMGVFPDAFLYSYNDGWMWDEQNLLGIPVFHADYNISYIYNETISTECYFLPIWKSDRSSNQYLSHLFFMGWEDIELENNNEIGILENFSVTCKKCGGTNIEKEDSRSYSEMSGGWGSLDFVCVDCGNRESID